MKRAKQSFGGGWTEKKLESVRQYLIGYRTALKNTPFKTAYIDAFAGTGYRTTSANNEPESLLFPEMDSFLDGSARIALQVEPRFHKYIFIEKDPNRFAELQKLKEEFPLPLYNSRKNPIFVLCFAVGNPKGKYPALRISRHILEK